MVGPIPSYLTTQTTAQAAFTVPFGLLAYVNAGIATATAAGEFNTTVNCSLFSIVDVSNLRIYLDSLGYTVDFTPNATRSLNIGWGKFLDVPGTEVIVDQGTTPWQVAGTLDQGLPTTSANAWPVYFQTALTATITAIPVTTTPILLLVSNASRKSFIVQNTSMVPVFVTLDSTSSTGLYSVYLPSKGIYEDGGYCGPIAAVTTSGSTTVMVTEKE